MSKAHALLELNCGVELKIKFPHDEKQPWTIWAPSVGAAEASSTPEAVDEAAVVVVVAARGSAANTGYAATSTAASVVNVFIFVGGYC